MTAEAAAWRVSEIFADRLRAHRRFAALTQDQLAERVTEADSDNAMAGPTIAKIELGTRQVKLDEAVVFAVVLGVPLLDLLLPMELAEPVRLTADVVASAGRVREVWS